MRWSYFYGQQCYRLPQFVSTFGVISPIFSFSGAQHYKRWLPAFCLSSLNSVCSPSARGLNCKIAFFFVFGVTGLEKHRVDFTVFSCMKWLVAKRCWNDFIIWWQIKGSTEATSSCWFEHHAQLCADFGIYGSFSKQSRLMKSETSVSLLNCFRSLSFQRCNVNILMWRT